MKGAEIVVVGRSSVLAREFAGRYPDLVLRSVGHAQADGEGAYEGARCVVNFAYAPSLETSPYEPALDIDLRVAACAARRGLHYVMVSSRRVYAADRQWNAEESAPATGMDAYGRNKSRTEAALQALLGDRLTILRPGNVVAYEPFVGRRRFGAYLQNQLATSGRILLTVDAAARRDLVPVEFFCDAVQAAVTLRVPGIFNVGAGQATAVGEAARWLIAGFGSGELVCDPKQAPDEFQLDCGRLKQTFGLRCDPGAVKSTLETLGRRLAAARPA